MDALERRERGGDANDDECRQAAHHANLMADMMRSIMSKHGIPPHKAVPLVRRDLVEWGIWPPAPAPDIEEPDIEEPDDGLSL
jgi:hypothetical protein